MRAINISPGKVRSYDLLQPRDRDGIKENVPGDSSLHGGTYPNCNLLSCEIRCLLRSGLRNAPSLGTERFTSLGLSVTDAYSFPSGRFPSGLTLDWVMHKMTTTP